MCSTGADILSVPHMYEHGTAMCRLIKPMQISVPHSSQPHFFFIAGDARLVQSCLVPLRAWEDRPQTSPFIPGHGTGYPTVSITYTIPYTRFATTTQATANRRSPAVTITDIGQHQVSSVHMSSVTRPKKKGTKKERTAPEPRQTIHVLPWHLDVHPPHATNDVHGQDDGAEHGQLA